MSRMDQVVDVADLAAVQWGMFTAAQARREGLSVQTLARLTDAGHLERVRHGVYRISGTPASPPARLQAAWLALQPGLTVHERVAQDTVEVVSHRSAAQLYQLGDVGAYRLEFTTPQRRQARDKEIRFHRGNVARSEWTLVEGLPTTTPLRTIVDLAHEQLDGDHLAGVVRDAVTTLHLDLDQVVDALGPYAHHYGLPLGDGQAFLTDLLQRVGIPQATRAAADLLAVHPELQAALQAFQESPALRAMDQIQLSLNAIQDATRIPRVIPSDLEAGLEAFQRAMQSLSGLIDEQTLHFLQTTARDAAASLDSLTAVQTVAAQPASQMDMSRSVPASITPAVAAGHALVAQKPAHGGSSLDNSDDYGVSWSRDQIMRSDTET